MTPGEVRARFIAARVARLATADAHGVPHVVPITFAVEGDTIVSVVDAKPKRSARLRRIANLRANPRASLLVDHYAADWSELWWARADGTARIAADGSDLDRAAALLRARYPQYGRVELVGPAIIIEVERWSGWTASSM
jgi:PPOX class probable F420-dependent enzyme